jgi:hypothetical protein
MLSLATQFVFAAPNFEAQFHNFIARKDYHFDLSPGQRSCAAMTLVKILKSSLAVHVKGEVGIKRHVIYSPLNDQLLSSLALVVSDMQKQGAPVLGGYDSWDDFKAQKTVSLMKDIHDRAFAKCAISSDDAITKCSEAFRNGIMDFDECIELRLGPQNPTKL